jgi:hypothetical protein
MNVRLAGPIVLVALAVIGAGCGSSSHASSAPSPASSDSGAPTTAADNTTTTTVALPKACDVITRQQADAAIGLTLQAPVAGGAEGTTSCTITAPPTGPVGQVEVYIGPGAKKIYDIDQTIGHAFTAVPNLGDEAKLEPGALFFRKGDNWVAVRITSLDDSDAQIHAGLLALAKAIDAKLPS